MATDEGATHEPSTTQAGGGAAFGPEWMQADALTDKVIDTVDRVKEKTTDNAVLALRAIVFGIVVSVLAIAVLLLSVIMLVRFADAYLPIGSGVGDATWAAHGFVGICFSLLGLGAWMSRKGEGRPTPLIAAGIVVFLTLFTFLVLAIASLF